MAEPSELLDCLDNVVGLTDTDCPCFIDGEEPEGYNTSLSGLYLDDPEFGFPLKIPQNIDDCSSSDLWTRLVDARSAGIKQFISDLGAEMIGGPLKKKVEPFNGFVGDDKVTLNLTPEAYFAIRLEPKIFRGVIAKIRTVTLYAAGVNGTNVEVGIYDEEALQSGTPILAFDVPIVNGKGTYTFTDPEVFNFQSDDNTERDLYMVVIVADHAGILPKNNKTKCSCGKKEKWDQFFNAHGLTASTLDGLIEANESSYAYGFRISLGVACGNSWLCQPFDFINDAWARVMAECIALYSMRKLAGMILSNPFPEKYTIITREEIALHRDRVNTILGERMPWLAANIPVDYTDCFKCNSKVKVSEHLV